MWSMNSKIGAVEKVGFVFVTSTISYILFEGTMMTDQTWALVSSGSILLNMSARVPQIITNYSANSTGQLAFVTFFLAWAGSVARTATVLLNSDDFMYKMQFVIALGLNSIIMIQFGMYWSNKPTEKKKARLVPAKESKKTK